MPRQVRVPDAADLDLAWERVRRVLAPTPLLPGAGLFLKAETLQPTGSFKIRGAVSALAGLPAGTHAVTASAGNHGLAMAHASTLTGMDTTVVVSTRASRAKVGKLRDYPITLIEHGDDFDQAEQHALSLPGDYVSAYNDPAVIAGQATIGRELDEQIDGPLTVVVPVGGGGLAAGMSLWAESRPGTRVVGVESAVSLAVSEAVASGAINPVTVGPSIADGITGNIEPGCVTPDILRARAEFTSVTDAEIRTALRWLFTEHGLVTEGAGACGVAAVLAGKVEITGRPVIVLSGRNITIPAYTEALTHD